MDCCFIKNMSSNTAGAFFLSWLFFIECCLVSRKNAPISFHARIEPIKEIWSLLFEGFKFALVELIGDLTHLAMLQDSPVEFSEPEHVLLLLTFKIKLSLFHVIPVFINFGHESLQLK